MEQGSVSAQGVAGLVISVSICDNTIDPAFGECFNEGFDGNVGQQPVTTTDDENYGQQPIASDEDFDEVPNDDGQQPHDFDDDPKYPPNNDSSEAPNGDPSEAPNGDQPSVVVSSARYVNLARVKYYYTSIT